MTKTSAIEHKIGEVKEWLGTGSINVFGRQFAGKDVQLNRLAKLLGTNIPVLSGGEILRQSDNISPDDRAAMNRGELIDSEAYKRYILPGLSAPEHDGKPLLLSAVGRMIGEEASVLEATSAAGHPTLAVVELMISDQEAHRRLARSDRKRPDDTPEALDERLNWFADKTIPVLDVYEDMGLLMQVDATPPEEVVFSDLVDILHARATQ